MPIIKIETITLMVETVVNFILIGFINSVIKSMERYQKEIHAFDSNSFCFEIKNANKNVEMGLEVVEQVQFI